MKLRRIGSLCGTFTVLTIAGCEARETESEPHTSIGAGTGTPALTADRHVAPEVLQTPLEVTPALLSLEDIVGFMQANTDGTVGIYAKEVSGSVLTAFNETTIFEPASSIKVLVHFHATRQVQLDAALTLADPTDWLADAGKFGGGVYECGGSDCYADNTEPQTDPLSDVLRLMMECSDNAATQATRDVFGDANIMTTAYNVVGVSADTQLNHSVGCGADAVASHNQFTLVDAGLVYEQAAAGLLDDPTRASFYDLMANDDAFLSSVVDAEQASVGLTDGEVTTLKSGIETAWKGGSYGLSDGSYRSLAGWAAVPLACENTAQEYVFGNFVDAATDLDLQDTGEDISVFQVAGMLLRDPIVAAMQSALCDRPPTLFASNVLILECNQSGGVASNAPAVVEWLESPTASDECGTPEIAHAPLPDLLPVGCPNDNTPVVFSAIDSCGNVDEQNANIYVEDTTGPTISCAVDTQELFPADHGFVDVGFDFAGTDMCDPEQVSYVVEVHSDEPTATAKGVGGSEEPDAIIGDDGSVQLRAERSGNGDGRVYRIQVIARDSCGNTTACEAVVGVPRNPASGPAVDSGGEYDATGIN